MDFTSWYRKPLKQKVSLNVRMAAYTVRNNYKSSNKLKAPTPKKLNIKDQIEANKKLRNMSLRSNLPSLRNNRTPISRYFHSFKL